MTTNKQLRELAEKATPGKWGLSVHTNPVWSFDAKSDDWTISVGGMRIVAMEDGFRNASDVRFVAAASPATILALLDENETLQSECKELRTALAESRANDLTAMGYLNQIRQLVGGDDFPDMVRRCERLQAKCARLQAAMIEAKSYIDHYMYGGSIYREPAAEAIAIIDAAMEGDKP